MTDPDQPAKDSEREVAAVRVQLMAALPHQAADLQETEHAGRILLECSPDCVQLMDSEGHLQFMNAAGLALWEMDSDSQWRGKSWLSLWPASEASLLSTAVRNAALGQASRLQAQSLTAKGKMKWWDVVVSPVPREGAEPASWRVVAVSRDVTEQRIAEVARGKLAAIVHTSTDAIVSKDLNGIISSWNEAAEHIFGYSEAEAVGQSVMMLLPVGQQQEEVSIMERIRRGVRVEPYDTRRRRKDGTIVEVSVAISPILDAKGRIVGASKIAREITDRRQMEESLTTADRRKDEFLATLAHELRNPLAPIRMGLEVLKRVDHTSASGEQTRAMMERQVRQLARLVDDLLDMSRISSGRIELDPSPVLLSAVLDSALESSRPLIEKSGHELDYQPSSDALMVNADLTRLAQVFVNLLNNAAKYTPPGGHISLSVERRGEEAFVSVRDTGVGIAPDELPHIFEMFAQIKGSSALAQGGLGIGLSLVKRLVELHGGSVEGRSEGEGCGAEFVVRLKLCPATAAVSAT